MVFFLGIFGGIFFVPTWSNVVFLFQKGNQGFLWGWWNFKYFFSPRSLGQMIQIDKHVFQMGGKKPPPRMYFVLEKVGFPACHVGFSRGLGKNGKEKPKTLQRKAILYQKTWFLRMVRFSQHVFLWMRGDIRHHPNGASNWLVLFLHQNI